MRKFEIIKDSWINKIDEPMVAFNAIKISTISSIRSFAYIEPFVISLFSGGSVTMTFNYHTSEKEQYENDLLFLKQLLIT
jgi:hypothetical protein